MPPRTTILPILSILSWLVLLLVGSTAFAKPHRNVVLIVTDDQGLDLGCYGNTAVRTPNLDALAADGTRFTHAFATTASCSASRSVILTGLHNHANRQYGHLHAYHHFHTARQVASLPKILNQNGYRTGRIGKFHVGPDETYPFAVTIPGNSRSPVEMADATRGFVGEKSDKPFFLYFCTSDPHRSDQVNTTSQYRPDRFGNTDKPRPGIVPHRVTMADVIVPPFLPDTPECRAELVEYYESINRIDQGVGRLVEVLKAAGVYDDTLIIFTADHGPAFAGAKTTTYEPGLRVPLLVRNPDTPDRGDINDAMISFVDFAPTILDFAGIAFKPTQFHGRSFLPAMTEDSRDAWNKVYASHTFHEVTMYYPMRVVREERFKLIWNIAHGLPYPFATDLWTSPTWQTQFRQGMNAPYGKRTVGDYIHRPRFELYDLENDPHEAHNLADDPAHAEVFQRLVADMKAWQKKTADPWILKWDYE